MVTELVKSGHAVYQARLLLLDTLHRIQDTMTCDTLHWPFCMTNVSVSARVALLRAAFLRLLPGDHGTQHDAATRLHRMLPHQSQQSQAGSDDAHERQSECNTSEDVIAALAVTSMMSS